jgi:hypothetical protein
MKERAGIPSNETLIGYNMRMYQRNKKKIDFQRQNPNSFKEAKDRLISQEINCFKYNYSFDEETQNFNNFEATIQLSPDGRSLIITNKKPVNNP